MVTGGAAALDLTVNALNKGTTSFDSSGLTGDVVVSAAMQHRCYDNMLAPNQRPTRLPGPVGYRYDR